MRVLVFLVGMLLLMPSALALEPAKDKDGKDNVDHIQEALDRLGKLDATRQRNWLQRLETRAARAAKLTLEPNEAARHTAKTRIQLHQQTVTWQTLGDVADDTDAREKAAIDRLVKRYRTLVFEAFHKQINEYGKRQQAWLDVRADWKRAGSQFDQQDRLIDWLEAATGSVTPGKMGPIPEKPKFEPPPKAEDTKPAAEPKKATDGAGPIEPGPPPAIARTKKAIAMNLPPRAAEPPLPRPEPAEVALESNHSPIRLLVWRHEAAQRGAASAFAAPPATFSRSWEPQPRTVGDGGVPRQRREVKTIAVSQPTSSERVARKVPVVEPPKEVLAPPEKVEIQPDELAARIGGCNLAFRALETELNEKGDWTAARLEPLADRLKLLVTRRSDLQLFRAAISDEQRRSIEPLASPKGVVSPLAARIVEARGRATGSNFHGTEVDRQAELQRLDELSRLLAELAGK